MTFERKIKLYVEIASQIQHLIAMGRLKPGDRLPPERRLAETLRSRTSVRDAIRVLETKGLVEPRHRGRGTIVRQVSVDNPG